jgi:hypothetical protein
MLTPGTALILENVGIIGKRAVRLQVLTLLASAYSTDIYPSTVGLLSVRRPPFPAGQHPDKKMDSRLNVKMSFAQN